MKRWLVSALAFASIAADAQEFPSFDPGWLLFGDVYHVPSHHLEDAEGATGAVIRRGYLTFDAQISDTWEGRLRFELNQAGEFETYDFEVEVKDLHVARDLGDHEMVIGLGPTPTFDVIEDTWGLRYLARTPMDMQGVASRDSGLRFSGPIAGDGSLSYSVMAGVGLEFGAESGNGAKYMASLAWEPSENYVIEAYLDFEELSGNTDRTTAQLFAGYQGDETRWGLQYSHQDRQDDPTLELASAFVVHRLTQQWDVIGRVDRIMEPSPRGDNISYIPFDPSAPATMFLGGFEFRLSQTLRLTPNAIVIHYDNNDDGVRPNTDLQLRLTVFLDYE